MADRLEMQNLDPPIRDSLVECLREEIRTLNLAPSLKLTNTVLRQRFAVGHSSVREVLSVLSGEGLVERESRRGFRVKPMSMDDFGELTETRIILEIALLKHAIELSRPQWGQQLNTALSAVLVNDHRVGDDRPLDRHWEASHRRFHYALVDGYRASIQRNFLDRIYDQFDRYRTLAIPRRAFLATTANDHREMSEAALAGDFHHASTILTRHVRDASEAILTNIRALHLANRAGAITHRVIETGEGQKIAAFESHGASNLRSA